MRRQLAEIVKGFEHAQARLEKLVENTPEERWAVRSNPDRWSVAECVAHLNLTSAAYIPRIREAISEARRLGPVRVKGYRRDAIGWLFSAMVGPLPSLGRFRIGRVKTPAKFVPTGNQPQQLVLAEFKRDQDELIRMARESGGDETQRASPHRGAENSALPLDKVWIRSPFGERIRYNCYSAFVILHRHQERHLQQAERVWAE